MPHLRRLRWLCLLAVLVTLAQGQAHVADARLEHWGPVSLALPTVPPAVPFPLTLATTEVITFVNHYDNSSQTALIQLPEGYTGVEPVPLVLYGHGRYAAAIDELYLYGPTANDRGWLLAIPELHGHWPTPRNPPGTFAYGTLEAQYDLLSTLQYLLSHSPYNIDTDHIYIAGNSMGGQLATLTGAKYPDVFAAVFGNKGPSDFTAWYSEQLAFGGAGQVQSMKEECYTGPSNSPTPQAPGSNPFCYARGSSLNFAPNFLHLPLTMHHSQLDRQVPVTHTLPLRDAINALGPDQPVLTHIDTLVASSRPPDYHCYLPNVNYVFDRFETYTLNSRPTTLTLVSDESKSFYWLNLQQTGVDHWTAITATANLVAHTVTLVVSDTQTLGLGINLGSAPIEDWIGLGHPGLGLLPGSYHIEGAGWDIDANYSSGYLTLNLPPTNQTVITIARSLLDLHQLWLPDILR